MFVVMRKDFSEFKVIGTLVFCTFCVHSKGFLEIIHSHLCQVPGFIFIVIENIPPFIQANQVICHKDVRMSMNGP